MEVAPEWELVCIGIMQNRLIMGLVIKAAVRHHDGLPSSSYSC
jgi:hypothetical protein